MDAPACESCKIILIASDIVFAASCGHLFHDVCLNTIYDSDFKRCPGCSTMCLSSQSLRIYLPFQVETSTPESLVIKCKMIKHELKEVQKNLDSAAQVQSNLDKYIEETAAKKNRKVRKIVELRAIIKEKENVLKNINEQKKLLTVHKVLSDTQNFQCVNKLLKENHSAATLATMDVLMKRQIASAKMKKQEEREKMREDRKKNEALVGKYESLRKKYQLAVARSINKGRN